MLGQLPGVFAAGELTHIWDRGIRQNQLCGCGRPFLECPFWTEVLGAAFGGKEPLDYEEIEDLRSSVCALRCVPQLALPRLRTQRFRTRLQRYSGRLRSLYQAIRDVTGCDVIVDSSKYPPEAFLLRSMDDIDLAIVHLVRNSNAVAYAWQKRKIRPEIYWTTAYYARYSFIKTALAWDAFNFLIGRLRSAVPYALIRYEDIVRQPREAVGNVCRLVGLADHGLTFIGDDTVELRPGHAVSGAAARFADGVVPLELDIEWKAKAPRVQRAIVNALTLYWQRKYGYV